MVGGRVVGVVKGANLTELQTLVNKLLEEAGTRLEKLLTSYFLGLCIKTAFSHDDLVNRGGQIKGKG